MSKSRLSRWSERKAQSRANSSTRGSAAPVAVADDVDQVAPELEHSHGAVAVEETLEEEVEPTAEELAAEAREHGLPELDTLDKDSDFSGFMSGKISEALKRAALRKLWRTDAVFANLDGLNDYDEDFNVIDTLITAAQTNYKVGKGIVSDDEDEEMDDPSEDGGGKDAEVAGNAELEPSKKRAEFAADEAEQEADTQDEDDVSDGDDEIG